MKTLGENITTARNKLGYTQRHLAELLNVAPQTVYRWEKGDRFPKDKDKQRLAALLNITVAQLIGETDLPTSQTAPLLKVAPTAAPAPKPAGGLDTQAALLRDRIQTESGNLSDAMRARVQEILQECMRYLETNNQRQAG